MEECCGEEGITFNCTFFLGGGGILSKWEGQKEGNIGKRNNEGQTGKRGKWGIKGEMDLLPLMEIISFFISAPEKKVYLPSAALNFCLMERILSLSFSSRSTAFSAELSSCFMFSPTICSSSSAHSTQCSTSYITELQCVNVRHEHLRNSTKFGVSYEAEL